MKNNPYTNHFYENQKDDSYLSAKTMLPFIIGSLLVPIRSVVDFGCGAGTWLKAAEQLGIHDILGLDFGDNSRQLMIRHNQFMRQDLTIPIHLGRKFDLVMSTEVAEHLSHDVAEEFIQSLCRHGDLVLFSAAIPGQGGTHHVNEQYPSYWIDIFEKNDFLPLDFIRPHFWNDKAIPVWYRQNMLLFVNKHLQKNISLLKAKKQSIYDIVHPELFGLHVNQAAQFHFLVSWIKENVGNVGRLNISGKLYEIGVNLVED